MAVVSVVRRSEVLIVLLRNRTFRPFTHYHSTRSSTGIVADVTSSVLLTLIGDSRRTVTANCDFINGNESLCGPR